MGWILGGLWVVLGSAVAGYFAAADRGGGGLGAVLGLFLGPVGVVAALGVDRRPVETVDAEFAQALADQRAAGL
jgi:hypothetical protein